MSYLVVGFSKAVGKTLEGAGDCCADYPGVPGQPENEQAEPLRDFLFDFILPNLFHAYEVWATGIKNAVLAIFFSIGEKDGKKKTLQLYGCSCQMWKNSLYATTVWKEMKTEMMLIEKIHIGSCTNRFPQRSRRVFIDLFLHFPVDGV